MKEINQTNGFTLIELLIVVVIISILASFAFPAYRGHVIKSRRVSAEGCLLQYAQLMERSYSTGFTYQDIDGDASNEGAGETLPSLQCATEINNFYTFSLSAALAQSYTLQAVPTSAQDDAKCGTVTITQAGVKTESGTATYVKDCW